MENVTAFQSNDRYWLENEKFRLYYTLVNTETQTLTVVMEANFGKSYEMLFSFNETDDDKEEEFTRSTNNSVVYEVDYIVSLTTATWSSSCPPVS